MYFPFTNHSEMMSFAAYFVLEAIEDEVQAHMARHASSDWSGCSPKVCTMPGGKK